jgi:hypothetical protein
MMLCIELTFAKIKTMIKTIVTIEFVTDLDAIPVPTVGLTGGQVGYYIQRFADYANYPYSNKGQGSVRAIRVDQSELEEIKMPI